MPETPDFDAIATALMALASKDGNIVSTTAPEIVQQLRLVWNARGAADIALIHAVGEHVIELIRGEWGEDSGSARELTEALDALRALDR